MRVDGVVAAAICGNRVGWRGVGFGLPDGRAGASATALSHCSMPIAYVPKWEGARRVVVPHSIRASFGLSHSTRQISVAGGAKRFTLAPRGDGPLARSSSSKPKWPIEGMTEREQAARGSASTWRFRACGFVSI